MNNWCNRCESDMEFCSCCWCPNCNPNPKPEFLEGNAQIKKEFKKGDKKRIQEEWGEKNDKANRSRS